MTLTVCGFGIFNAHIDSPNGRKTMDLGLHPTFAQHHSLCFLQQRLEYLRSNGGCPRENVCFDVIFSIRDPDRFE